MGESQRGFRRGALRAWWRRREGWRQQERGLTALAGSKRPGQLSPIKEGNIAAKFNTARPNDSTIFIIIEKELSSGSGYQILFACFPESASVAPGERRDKAGRCRCCRGSTATSHPLIAYPRMGKPVDLPGGLDQNFSHECN